MRLVISLIVALCLFMAAAPGTCKEPKNEQVIWIMSISVKGIAWTSDCTILIVEDDGGKEVNIRLRPQDILQIVHDIAEGNTFCVIYEYSSGRRIFEVHMNKGYPFP